MFVQQGDCLSRRSAREEPMAHRSAIGPQDLQEMEAGRGVRQHQPGSGTLGRNLLSQGNLHQDPVLLSGVETCTCPQSRSSWTGWSASIVSRCLRTWAEPGCRGDHVLDQQDTPCRHAFIMRVHGYRARENAVCPASIRALRMPDELAHAIDLRPFLRADRSASRSVPGCGPGHRGGMRAPLPVAGAAC